MFCLPKVTIVRLRFKVIKIVEQVVKSQTSYPADSDFTRDIFFFIYKKS